jgi:hypothetical protein
MRKLLTVEQAATPRTPFSPRSNSDENLARGVSMHPRRPESLRG